MNNSKQNATPKAARIAVSVFFFISGFSFSTWTARIPDLQHQLHLNDAQLGSILFMMPLGLLITMPLVAFLLGRFSSRSVMLAGALLFALLLCLLGMAQKTWQVLCIFFMFGASKNIFNISVNTQSVGVQALYPTSIIASFHGIWSVAAFIGAAFASLMVSLSIAPLLHFIVVGILMLLFMALAYKYTLQKDDTEETEKKPVFAWPNKALLVLGLIAFCGMVCEGTMSYWGGIFFGEAIKAPAKLITVGYVAYLCAVAVGRLLGDWLVNKIGDRRLLLLSGLLITIGFLLSILLPYIVIATIGFFVTGIGISCLMPLVFSNTAKMHVMATGPAIASVSTVGYLGFLSGPPLIGFIAHAVNIKVSFLVAALFGMGITFLVSRLKLP